jgi:osmoprotectant transport system substrate-binding protein
MSRSRSIGFVILTIALLSFAGCNSKSNTATTVAPGDTLITVGSFDFAESKVVAEVYSQALEANGYSVRRTFDLGPREFVFPALTHGLVDLVMEYAGTATTFVSLGAVRPSQDADEAHRQLVGVLDRGLVAALAAAPAQTANTFVVTRATAEKYGLHDLSDLASVAAKLTFGGPPECATRPLCLVGLATTYGVTFRQTVSLDAGGPVTREALRNGGVDIALLFTTDPAIGGEGFVELSDDRHLQPAENITPLIRTAIITRWGTDVVSVIDNTSRRLTTDAVRSLNAQMDSEQADVTAIAAAWLRSVGTS